MLNSQFSILNLNEAHDPCLTDGGDFAELLDGDVESLRRRGLFVDVDDTDGDLAAASEGEVRDVDAVAAENRADFSDHARLIVVADDHHRAAERRFNVDAADGHEPRAVRLEDRALDPPIAGIGVQLD